jgi:endonuclease/exonuclease/phosphatase family metal-dependent hydrolase
LKFSILSFNMQNGQPWNEADPDAPGHDLPATIEFLHQCNCDLLLLQEVEEGHDGGQQIQPPPNFTRLCQDLPNYHGQFAYPPINPDELPFGLGLAIFSRFPLTEAKTHLLPAADLTFPFGGRERRPSERILLAATAQLPTGPLRVLNTHLQAYFMLGTSSETHRAQRDTVEKILRQSPTPAILGGDFNCAPEENLVAQFSAAGFTPVQTDEITWRRRPYVLDHLFHSQNLRVLSHAVIPTPTSDHHAVRAELELIMP